MRIISVPYFIGHLMDDFDVPTPNELLIPDLPGDSAAYATSKASGPGGPGQQRLAVLYSQLASRIESSGPSLVYAGDCLCVIGVLAGLQRKGISPTLYWFDAHGDFHTWETSQSRFLGGMPLAMITGRGEQTIADATGMKPLDDHSVVLVGARDLDQGEDSAVASSAMTVMPVDEVMKTAPVRGPIYIHVDVDVIDPIDVPAVNYPSPDGPSADSVKAAVEHLASSGRVVAASVSSWNPQLPGAGTSADAVRSIMDVFIA
jgi:arginase